MDGGFDPDFERDRAALAAFVEASRTPEFQRICQRNAAALTAISNPLSFDCILAGRRQQEEDIVRTVVAAVQIAFYHGYNVGRGVGPRGASSLPIILPAGRGGRR